MNLLDLMVKIGVDDQASGKIGGIGNSIKSGLGTAAKAGVAAVATAAAAAVAAVGSIGKAAFDSYASFEQLKGGIDKLFGNSSDKMMQYAQSAYGTMGLSANDYMTQVTSFSAALINDLGGDTDKAADMANLAMKSMADNVSIFGSNVEDVQNAYQGFAKQNYTMLDNLKLGYGGTKEEMQRLIDDANEYAATQGKNADLTIDSFADIVEAIELVQDKQGIAGNAQDEIMKTLEGSINATKASWKNFVTELGKDDADLGKRATELADVAIHAADNIVKRIQVIAKNMAAALPVLIPKALEIGGKLMKAIAQGIAETVPSVMASLMQGGGQAVSGLVGGIISHQADIVKAVSDMFNSAMAWLSENASAIQETVNNMIMNAAEALGNAIPVVLEAIGLMWESLMTVIREYGPMFIESLVLFIQEVIAVLFENMPLILETVGEMFAQFIETLGVLLPMILEQIVNLVASIIENLTANAPAMFDAAKTLFRKMLEALNNALPDILNGLVDGLLKLIDTVIEHGPELLAAAGEFILNLASAIIDNLPQILNTLFNALGRLVTGVIQRVPDMLSAGVRLIGGLLQAIARSAPNIVSGIANLIMNAVRSIPRFATDMYNAGVDLINGLVRGIANNMWAVLDTITGGLQDAVDGALKFLGIASPSKLFAWIGDMTMQGMAEGIEDTAEKAENAMRKAAEGIYAAADGEIEVTGAAGLNGVSAGVIRPVTINIDTLAVREQADIDRIAEQLARKISRESGGTLWNQSLSVA